MKRRSFLQTAASAALVSFTQGRLRADSSRTLKSSAKQCEKYVGVQALFRQLQQPGFADLVSSNFNLLTPGLELKWERLRPSPEVFNFQQADWMVNYASNHQMRVHGHNLCWYVANPPWLEKTLSPHNARDLLTNHVSTVVKRYAGRVQSWDVVNEPMGVQKNRVDGLHPSPWLDALGAEYIDIAFHAAAAADPAALLVLNQNDLEQDSPQQQKTRSLFIPLLKQLLRRGVPIAAIGMESHLFGSLPVRCQERDNFISEVRNLGLKVIITELDVNDSTLAADEQTRDKQVADIYTEYLASILSTSHTDRITFWTLTDKDNWYEFDKAPQFTRNDGLPHRPGLLDVDLRPKRAYDDVLNFLDESLCKNVNHN